MTRTSVGFEEIDSAEVEALAAVLAESMTIPDVEREALRQRRCPSLETGGTTENANSESAEPADAT
jgi:hypothetical protein